MNPFWSQLIVQTTLQKKNKKTGSKESLSPYKMAKGHRELLITIKRHLKDLVLITAGIFAASFGFKGRLL